MKQHKSKILRNAAYFASREAAFIMAVLGVLCQAAHTWYIAYNLSSLEGFTKLLQAGLMALFFNGALLYFVLKGKSGDKEQQQRYRYLVITFAGLEVFMNLYYWSQHFIIEQWPDADWAKLIIAIPMALILPITLAMYSYEVRVDDYSDNEEETEKDKISNLNNFIEEKNSSILALNAEIDFLKEELKNLSGIPKEIIKEVEVPVEKIVEKEIIKEVEVPVEKIVEVPIKGITIDDAVNLNLLYSSQNVCTDLTSPIINYSIFKEKESSVEDSIINEISDSIHDRGLDKEETSQSTFSKGYKDGFQKPDSESHLFDYQQ